MEKKNILTKISENQDLWAKLKLSTRGTVIISWLLLLVTSAMVFIGKDVSEMFIKEVFYFALLVMLFSSCGLNGIEAVLGIKREKNALKENQNN